MNTSVIENKELMCDIASREKLNTEWKTYVDGLNKSEIDCVIFDEVEKSDIVLVFFAGFVENFIGLKRPCIYSGKSLYFRDKTNTWYDNKLNNVMKIINSYIKPTDKVVLIGQSMGAYIALYCSALINNSICLAFSPQTFNRTCSKVNIHSKILRNDPPYELINLHNFLTEHPNNSKRYIFVGSSEHENPNKRFWGDLLFAGYMLHVPNIYVVVTNQNVHTVYGALLFDSLLDIIIKKHEVLILDMVKGGAELNEGIKYKL